MKNAPFSAFAEPYRKNRNLRLLAVFALMASGYLLIMRTGPLLGSERMTPPVILLLALGVTMEYAGMISLILTVIHRWILRTARRETAAALKEQELLDEAVRQLSGAARAQLDGLTYACSAQFLYLPHGAVYPIQDVLWISAERDSVRFLFIPLVTMHWHTLHLADGSQAIAFYGKVRRQSEYDALIALLKGIKPDLLAGSAAQNEWQYFSRIRGKKKKNA